MQKNTTKRIVYTRIFGAFLVTYLILMTSFSIFLITEEKKTAARDLEATALHINNRVEEILKDYIDSDSQITDLGQVKKEFIKDASFFRHSGREMAVFTGDYQLVFNTNDYWLVSYGEYTEGNTTYTGYGSLNPREWFSPEETTELKDYLHASPQAKKPGDLSGYTLSLKGFWVDNEMIIPEKITVNPMYARNFDEEGNVVGSSGSHTDDIVYTSGYGNTKNLPYFEHGSLRPDIYGNIDSKKQAELRQLVMDQENLKEATVSTKFLEHSSERIEFLNYRYYLTMPYQNSVKVTSDDENYYSEFWTVLAQDISLWERSSTTLSFVWISCLLIFMVVALILSKQTYRTYQEREELEKQRQEMTNALAHDLKTPLSIISGYAQNLQENVHTEKREYYASHIQTNVERMDKIILGMLEMTKLKSDSIQLKLADISLADINKEIINRYQQIADEKSLRVSLGGEAVIQADKSLMLRVLDNFFINALDYTPEGGSISLRILEDRFEIYNSGSQIPEDKINEIWLPFQKANLARSNPKGTGLGLSIARSILELHKFSYGAQNSENGVIFWFEFR